MSLLLPPLRPPGAAAELFCASVCVCGQCVTVCPHKSLELMGGIGSSRRTPRVVPRETPCYLCMKSPVCPSGALNAAVADMAHAGMGREPYHHLKTGRP